MAHQQTAGRGGELIGVVEWIEQSMTNKTPWNCGREAILHDAAAQWSKMTSCAQAYVGICKQPPQNLASCPLQMAPVLI